MDAVLQALPSFGHAALVAVLIFGTSLLVGRLLVPLVGRLARRFAGLGWEPIARRATLWTCGGLGAAVALETLGVDLSVLLGAAGFASVALGFASQTTASNFISGLFLMLENSVTVGDFIEVGGVSGEVLSIDPLSVRLRTFDNRMVRVPNETLVKSTLTNLSGFPIRRIDLALQLPQDADLGAARDALLALAISEAQVLQEPAPIVQLQGFSQGVAQVQYSIWAARGSWIEVRSEIVLRVPGVLREVGVELGVPRMRVENGKTPPPEEQAAASS